MTTVEYCNEHHPVAPGQTLTIGRDADLVIDDNPYLHRRFLAVSRTSELSTLRNIGDRLTATLLGAGGLQAQLGPGTELHLAGGPTIVRFAAGSTAYELTVHAVSAVALPCPPPGPPEDLAATQGPGRLSPEQRRLVTALAEHRLRGDVLLGATVPSSAAAARRLGWTPQKFNRTLDRVCHKLEQLGVRGLHGGPGELAANRRSRLVDYALTTGLVTAVDLACLPGEADHG